MGVQVDMRVTELLCSRLCHDLVGPVGSINHGIELLKDSGALVGDEALEMVVDTGQQASNRLMFFRTAFGLSGGGAGFSSMEEARKLASGYLERQYSLQWPVNNQLPWRDHERTVPKDIVKVILNLLMIGIDCLPRGGTLTVSQAELPEGLGIAIVAQGRNAALKDEIQAALSPDASTDGLSAGTVQAYFLTRLAEDLGFEFEVQSTGAEQIQIAAVIPLA